MWLFQDFLHTPRNFLCKFNTTAVWLQMNARARWLTPAFYRGRGESFRSLWKSRKRHSVSECSYQARRTQTYVLGWAPLGNTFFGVSAAYEQPTATFNWRKTWILLPSACSSGGSQKLQVGRRGDLQIANSPQCGLGTGHIVRESRIQSVGSNSLDYVEARTCMLYVLHGSRGDFFFFGTKTRILKIDDVHRTVGVHGRCTPLLVPRTKLHNAWE